VEAVLGSPPPDDAGAETADRYEWQAAMAAADGLALYLDALDSDGRLVDDGGCRVVCEHHEDWCRVQGVNAELVSAKHRDPAVGVFTTLTQLAGDGGLRHLCDRWRALGEWPTCRLVTTAGLAAGPPAALMRLVVALREAQDTSAGLDVVADEDVVANLAPLLRPGPGATVDRRGRRRQSLPPATAEERDEVLRFLAMLTIESGRIGRAYVGFAAPGMFVEPVLIAAGRSDVPAAAVWEAVLALFRSRMRAGAPIPRGALPDVVRRAPDGGTSGSAELDRYLASRVVTLADIDVALAVATRRPLGFMPLRPLLRTTRVAVKMSVGGCTDNAIERAEELRMDYQRYWRARVSADPAARAQQDRLRRSLLGASDRATARVGVRTPPWGADLWRELEAETHALPNGSLPGDMDPDLLLGGLSDLANRCRIWFSDAFDVDSELGRRRAEQEAPT
jgi:hypothetical protein